MGHRTSATDTDLAKLQRDSFSYFLYEASATNGLVIDKTAPDTGRNGREDDGGLHDRPSQGHDGPREGRELMGGGNGMMGGMNAWWFLGVVVVNRRTLARVQELGPAKSTGRLLLRGTSKMPGSESRGGESAPLGRARRWLRYDAFAS